jgi:endonuclease YncB( thermonuclease family)
MRRPVILSNRLLAVIFLILGGVSHGQAQEVVVTADSWRVVDGDTIHLAEHKIRLLGIDAPEIKQQCETADGNLWPCGKMARDMLEGLLESGGRGIACVISKKDRYQRDLGRCYTGSVDGGMDVQQILIRAGFAVSEYGKEYLQDEQIAAAQRRGMWAGHFLRPKEWRKAQRGG